MDLQAVKGREDGGCYGGRYLRNGVSGISTTAAAAAGTGAASSSPIDGLKLGKRTYFQDGVTVVATTKPRCLPAAPLVAALPPPKRARGVVQGGQPPRCQVEGCKTDLTGSKAYYCRHKVCGMHSKSPKVIVAGMEQRFCQQCSRSPLSLSLCLCVRARVLAVWFLVFCLSLDVRSGFLLISAVASNDSLEGSL